MVIVKGVLHRDNGLCYVTIAEMLFGSLLPLAFV
jgi:hypothetical protein